MHSSSVKSTLAVAAVVFVAGYIPLCDDGVLTAHRLLVLMAVLW